MTFRARLEALTEVLRPWSALWSRSILQTWPDFLAAAPGDWLAHVRPVEPYPKSYGFDPAELESYMASKDKALFVVTGDEAPVGYIALSRDWPVSST